MDCATGGLDKCVFVHFYCLPPPHITRGIATLLPTPESRPCGPASLEFLKAKPCKLRFWRKSMSGSNLSCSQKRQPLLDPPCEWDFFLRTCSLRPIGENFHPRNRMFYDRRRLETVVLTRADKKNTAARRAPQCPETMQCLSRLWHNVSRSHTGAQAARGVGAHRRVGVGATRRAGRQAARRIQLDLG